MLTLQDAKNRFSAVVDAALSGRPQSVSRRGKPAVVVISASEYERLLGLARSAEGSFAAHLRAFPATGTDEAFDRISAQPRDAGF